MTSDIFIVLLLLLTICGGMYIYFPEAWPRVERNVLIPYILWFSLLCFCYMFLQKKRGTLILN